MIDDGAMFLKIVDYIGDTKDKYFILNLMKEVIKEICHQNIIKIIIYNASNYKNARQIIES